MVETVIDLVENCDERPFVAFEFFPPKTSAGVEALYGKIETLVKEFKPLYLDFTWGAGGSTADLTLELSLESQKRFHIPSNMHLTCTNMPKDKIDHALHFCRKHDIRSILALRGDPPVGQTEFETVENGFSCALDLVKHIRNDDVDKQFHFGLTVAGYPEGHPNVITLVDSYDSLSESEKARSVKMDDGSIHVCSDEAFEGELAYLREKVDAGAQMIVTQMFFDVETFIEFKRRCEESGITVPIIPGIMCITTYGGFKRMVNFCKTRVPDHVLADLEHIKEDPNKMLEYGVQFGIDMCNRLLDSGVKGLHFYTLNQDKVVGGIIDGISQRLYA